MLIVTLTNHWLPRPNNRVDHFKRTTWTQMTMTTTQPTLRTLHRRRCRRLRMIIGRKQSSRTEVLPREESAEEFNTVRHRCCSRQPHSSPRPRRPRPRRRSNPPALSAIKTRVINRNKTPSVVYFRLLSLASIRLILTLTRPVWHPTMAAHHRLIINNNKRAF